MKELVATLVHYLVDEPDRMSVRDRQDRGRRVLELAVARPDLGRVIGKSGRTAAALRLLVDAVAARRGEACTLEILD
jgi:uncharacterized protein